MVQSLIRPGLAFVLLVALVGATPTAPVSAQTITVTTTAEAPGVLGDCTLGEAVQAAQTNAAVDACLAGTSTDTIVLQPDATYTLTLASSTTLGPSAFVISTAVTVQGNGATLSHDPAGGGLRFFRLTDTGNLTLTNLTLRGGRALANDGADSLDGSTPGENGVIGYGGAIRDAGGILVLDGVHFIGNLARGGNGGDGFYTGPGSGTNGGDGGGAGGGALFALGTLTILGGGATFTDNEARGGNGGQHGYSPTHRGGSGGFGIGGALFTSGDVTSTAALAVVNNRALGGAGQDGGGGGYGGGFAIYDLTTLTGAVFENNRAQGGNVTFHAVNSLEYGGEGEGGAIYSLWKLTVSQSRVYSNTAVGGNGPSAGRARGGGVHISGAPNTFLNVQQSTIISNTAQGGVGSKSFGWPGDALGGGLYALQLPVRLESMAIVGNAVISGTNPQTTTLPLSDGGGAWFAAAPTGITNTTVARNSAGRGGGLFNGTFGSTRAITLTHVTVYSNTADQGGGLNGVGGPFVSRNSLLAHNTGGNCAGMFVVLQGDNIQFPGATCGTATQSNPLLGTLADHGGGTLTVDLLAGSLAIDLADPAYCPPTDQRGEQRPIGAACDLGAYERWAELFLPLLLR